MGGGERGGRGARSLLARGPCYGGTERAERMLPRDSESGGRDRDATRRAYRVTGRGPMAVGHAVHGSRDQKRDRRQPPAVTGPPRQCDPITWSRDGHVTVT